MGEAAAITIDRLRKEDIERALVIEQASFSMPWSQNLFLAEFRNPGVSLMLAARDAGQAGGLVGFIVCWVVADELHILDLAVDPELRRQGIGRRLVCAAAREAMGRGAARAFLEVRESNRAAIALYEELGFSCTIVREGYYDFPLENAVVMAIEREGLEKVCARHFS